MKLLTLNCHSWQEENQLDKINYLAKNIKEMQYDVIALQEVSQHKDSKIKYNTIKEDNYAEVLINELKKLNETKYNYVWDFSHIGYDIYEEGLAILTKHPIVAFNSFYVSKDSTITNYKSRKIVSATIKINNKDVDFYSCHLGWWHDETEPFKDQADMLIKHIDNNKLNFIMGDFNNNAFVKDEGYDYLIKNKFIDTYVISKIKDNGITAIGKIDGWKTDSQDKRLDLILTNKDIQVNESKVVFNTEGTIISDHFGVVIDLDY